MNSYTPPTPSTYKPTSTSQEADAHFSITTTRNPDLKGDVTFRYPTVFDEVMIGARISDIVNAGRSTPILLETLPWRARLYAQAIATLEVVIKTAPKGFYVEGASGEPILAPGAVGDGDEEVILETLEAFTNWRNRFRRVNDEAGDSNETPGVVRSNASSGEPGQHDVNNSPESRDSSLGVNETR